MNNKEKIQYTGIILLAFTLSSVFRIDFIGIIISLFLAYIFFKNIIASDRDKFLIISIILGLVSYFILGWLWDKDIFDENGNYNIWFYSRKIVPVWIAGIFYIFLLKKEKTYKELDKVNALLDVLKIYPLSIESGKIAEIHIVLDKNNERLFYEINPKYLPFISNSIDNIIENTRNPNQYGYDYARRIFFIGDKKILEWAKDISK
ncbi:MAG: hypothetical protein Q4B95_09885 [Lonepinella koalarum]|nr:hypothetical protein [Lonepinella koalarum]